jgi:hypothetical protein
VKVVSFPAVAAAVLLTPAAPGPPITIVFDPVKLVAVV